MSATPTSAASSVHGLVRVLLREYTSASVSANPLDASRLDLVRLRDGNYAEPSLAPFDMVGSAALRSSASLQAGLSALTLGG